VRVKHKGQRQDPLTIILSRSGERKRERVGIDNSEGGGEKKMTIEYGAIIGGVSGGIITLLGYIFVTRWLNKKTQQRETNRLKIENLKKHFEDINSNVVSKICHMSQNFIKTDKRLVFSSISPIREHYDFGNEEYYQAFKIHLPDDAVKWEQLNKRAFDLNNSYVISAIENKPFNNDVFMENFIKLQKEFIEYGKTLGEKAINIDKYQIGTAFRYDDNCPICNRF
jgi:hypothetical protein